MNKTQINAEILIAIAGHLASANRMWELLKDDFKFDEKKKCKDLINKNEVWIRDLLPVNISSTQAADFRDDYLIGDVEFWTYLQSQCRRLNEQGRDSVMALINRIIKGEKLIIRPVTENDSEDVIEEMNWIEEIYKSLLPHDRERVKEFVGRFRMAKVG